MLKKYFFFATMLAFFLFLNILAPFAFATATPPEFSSCLNPQGTLKVSYSSGTHGVPGKTEAFVGSDSVYLVSSNSLIQCLCPLNKEGIQTNWWKVPSLTSEEIETFKTQGWIFVPDGSAWGLDPTAYLAKNSQFSCRAIGGGEILGVGQVLGLAATGNIKTVYLLLIFGFLFLAVGNLLNRNDV